MGLFSNFVDRVVAKKLDKVAQKMEQAGAQAVSIATDLVPVRTGKLQASIHYIFSRQEMSLSIFADEPYAIFVERGTSRMRARPYLAPAIRHIRKQFGLQDVSAQFATTPAKYQSGYRASSGPGTIIGRRVRGRGR